MLYIIFGPLCLLNCQGFLWQRLNSVLETLLRDCFHDSVTQLLGIC